MSYNTAGDALLYVTLRVYMWRSTANNIDINNGHWKHYTPGAANNHPCLQSTKCVYLLSISHRYSRNTSEGVSSAEEWTRCKAVCNQHPTATQWFVSDFQHIALYAFIHLIRLLLCWQMWIIFLKKSFEKVFKICFTATFLIYLVVNQLKQCYFNSY